MESTQYLDYLAADYAALRAAAITAGLDASVPSCPDWTVSDLLEHVASVYLHKVAVLRHHEWPKPWPPDFSGEDPAALLDRGYRELAAEFASRLASDPALTFYDPDQTVRFWLRRMAQETVIHRIDAEQAAGGAITPVPGTLGADGVDEVLKVFLVPEAVGWPDEFAELPGGHLAGDDGKDAIVVTAEPVPGITGAESATSWTIRPAPRSVTVTDGADDDGVRVTLSGPSGTVLRWMWGRADDSALTATGDPAWADYLRRMLVPATQLSPGGATPRTPRCVPDRKRSYRARLTPHGFWFRWPATPSRVPFPVPCGPLAGAVSVRCDASPRLLSGALRTPPVAFGAVPCTATPLPGSFPAPCDPRWRFRCVGRG
jgi:uncharacterized protein (TIGR03083 family)